MTDLVQNLKIGNTAYGIVSVKDCLTGSSDPTTSTAGYVGQRYLNTTNNKVFVCTAITPHQTPSNTHYATNPSTGWSYDPSTGYLKRSSTGNKSVVWYSPTVDVSNKNYMIVGKFYIESGSGSTFIFGSSSAPTNRISTWYTGWFWAKYVHTSETPYKLLYLSDNGYTKSNLPDDSLWTDASSSYRVLSTSGYLLWGETNSDGGSFLYDTNNKLDVANSFMLVDGIQYDLADVETTYTYTWNQQASTADLSSKQNTLTAGNGIDISSDTISAEEMVGADGVNIGKAGAVPAPTATDNTKFLRGDGTWQDAGSAATYNSTTQEITLG